MNPPNIKNPCPKSWHEMSGDDKRRFCNHCQLHVHNLSEMSGVERSDVLGEPDKVCIKYDVDHSGNFIPFADRHWLVAPFVRFRRAFVAFLLTIIPFGLSSCATRHSMGRPVNVMNKSASTQGQDMYTLGK